MSSDDAFLQGFGNSCCHGNTFSVCFSNCDFVGTCQHFSCFLGLKIFLWVLCIPNPMATLYLFPEFPA